ncbi:MAG: DUF3606 domain-containing protein [Pseudomonadota bacterium]
MPQPPATASTSQGLANQPIDINEESSVNYWVNTLHCSELELRVAVAEVGPMVSDVGEQLGRVL